MSLPFKNDADGQDIVSLVGDMTGINTTSEIKQITRACNEANKKVWSWIFDSFGGWQYDDGNYANLPSATANLVANQTDYTLPSEAIAVKAVEYKGENGDWYKLKSLPISVINHYTSEKEFQDEPNEPTYYGLLNGIVRLYPACDENRTAALRIQFDRGSVVFASDDTGQTPGFVSEFHEAVPVGASYFISANKSLPQTAQLRERWMDFEQRIKSFYIQRYQEEFPPKFRSRDLVGDYM